MPTMEPMAWLTLISIILSIGWAANGYFSNAKSDQIDLLKQEHEKCKAELANCRAEIMSMRGEIAWMRANMVFKNQQQGEQR